MFFGGNYPRIVVRKHLRCQASSLFQVAHNKMLFHRLSTTQYIGNCRPQRATTDPYIKDETSISTRTKETKSKPSTGEMGKKKENVKLRDLEPF
jgi:hypothetical protein